MRTSQALRLARAVLLLAVSMAGAGCGSEVTLPAGALSSPTHQDPPMTRAASTALTFASQQIGLPYCWGGTGPRCFDCSGLTQTAWAKAGVKLPRTADAIAATLPPVRLEDVRPGDILWWPGHVGLYAGNGWSIEALNARSGVVIRRAATPRRAFRPAELM